MVGSTSSRITECLAQNFLLLFSLSKAYLLLASLNNSLLEGDSEEVEEVLWALVFLGMVLRKGQKHKAEPKEQKKKRKKKKPSADYKLAQNKYKTKIYMMHEQIK